MNTVNASESICINKLKGVINDCFPKYWLPVEACLSTVATLLLKDNANPTSLVLVGPASTGKTTTLDFFMDIEGITYRSDHFTPKAFVTHYANKNKTELSELDLLSRILNKCLIVPDLGPIFGNRKDDVRNNLGILTRVLDGEGLSTDSGVHGQRKVAGKCMFSMLVATTPFGYNLWNLMGLFGSRLLFLSMPNNEMNANDIIEDMKKGIPYSRRKEICQVAVKGYLEELWNKKGGCHSVVWKDSEIPEDVLRVIVGLATIVASLRGMIPSLYEDGENHYQYRKPVIENPQRLVSLLLNIAKGRALIYGREMINSSDIPLLVEIALNSCPEDRSLIFRQLIKKESGMLTTAEVCTLLDVSPKTALKCMENLVILKLVDYFNDEPDNVGRPARVITLTKEMRVALEQLKVNEYFS